MTRIKRGITVRRRHRKIMKAAKGYRGLRSKIFRQAKMARMKAGIRGYVARKRKKRDFRRLWILRINAACRTLGLNYSRLISAMLKKQVIINRKMLAELAIHEPEVFKKIVEAVK